MGPLNVQLQQLAAPETLTNHRGIIQLRITELDLNGLIQLHSVFADDYISLWFLFDYLPLIWSDSFSALILFFLIVWIQKLFYYSLNLFKFTRSWVAFITPIYMYYCSQYYPSPSLFTCLLVNEYFWYMFHCTCVLKSFVFRGRVKFSQACTSLSLEINGMLKKIEFIVKIVLESKQNDVSYSLCHHTCSPKNWFSVWSGSFKFF